MMRSTASQKTYRVIAAALVALFLASVARSYHPGSGFRALIAFPEGEGSRTLRSIPHEEVPASSSYDGQFYAERAFDPLVRDPEMDRAMDLAPFRARRILFSWTAYALGLGRPAWILEAYALQNVLCWLVLAVVLTRWLPLTCGRGLALWAACLFSHGMMWSVRFALLDGPSVLLIALAVAAVETGRPLWSAAIVGLAGLGRETNLLAVFAQPRPVTGAWRLAAALALVAIPVLLWYDFLRSIYRSTLWIGADAFVLPGSGLAQVWMVVLRATVRHGLLSRPALSFCLLAGLSVQACYLMLRREYASPWWRVATAYAVMMLFLHPILVEPLTGAISRVLLAMTIGFNVLVAGESRPARFWTWFVAGNLHLIPGVTVLPLLPWL